MAAKPQIGVVRLGANTRLARRDGLIGRLHDFARSGLAKAAHRRAFWGSNDRAVSCEAKRMEGACGAMSHPKE
jgi:hypothetical protein